MGWNGGGDGGGDGDAGFLDLWGRFGGWDEDVDIAIIQYSLCPYPLITNCRTTFLYDQDWYIVSRLEFGDRNLIYTIVCTMTTIH